MRSVRLLRLGAILLSAFFASGPALRPALAAGPSFSCAKASVPVDRAICGDAKLSTLDLELARTFRAALAGASADHDEILAAQRQWLKGRGEACHLAEKGEASREQVACLAKVTRGRISALQPRDPRDLILAERIADELRRKNGFANKVGELVEALFKDADSPVRIGLGGDILTPELLAKLPPLYSFDDLKDRYSVYRFGGTPSILVAAAVAGTASCWYYAFFQQILGSYVQLADPNPGTTDDAHCGDDIGFGRTIEAPGKSEQPLPLFADATGNLDRTTLQLLALHGDRWHRIGPIQLDYETALSVSKRSCAAKVDCDALAADALTLARARDAAGAEAPQRLGAATRSSVLQRMGEEVDSLTDFGDDTFDSFSDFGRDAPAYNLQTSGGVVMRISHAWMGWREGDGYNVAAYRNEDGAWRPVAGFQIGKARVRLRSVTVQ